MRSDKLLEATQRALQNKLTEAKFSKDNIEQYLANNNFSPKQIRNIRYRL